MIVFLLLLFIGTADAGYHPENATPFQMWCNSINGQYNAPMGSDTIPCLTKTHAIFFSIGGAHYYHLHYEDEFGQIPAVIKE